MGRLNWDAIGAIAEGLGAMAVIVSVLYLAVQIKKQTQEAKLGATRELATDFRSVTEACLLDKELSAIYRRGIHEYESLPPDDRLRLSIYFMGVFRSMEQQHLHQTHGTMDSVYFNSMVLGFKELLAFPGVQRWWQLSMGTFDKEFGSHVETLLREAKQTIYNSSFRNEDNDTQSGS